MLLLIEEVSATVLWLSISLVGEAGAVDSSASMRGGSMIVESLSWESRCPGRCTSTVYACGGTPEMVVGEPLVNVIGSKSRAV